MEEVCTRGGGEAGLRRGEAAGRRRGGVGDRRRRGRGDPPRLPPYLLPGGLILRLGGDILLHTAPAESESHLIQQLSIAGQGPGCMYCSAPEHALPVAEPPAAAALGIARHAQRRSTDA